MKKLFLILGVTALLVSCGKTDDKKVDPSDEEVICAEPSNEESDSLSIEKSETDAVVEEITEAEGDSK